ncbi:alpha/beta hydrolase [Vibrio sp. ZSDE26]|uniref:Alpha/beta hydrolase n=1 Tax=Vibrio amylolyticus TaxID=2847292 RepID=A0A9X1XRH0_9VIBR|nr:alpha/beta hydrolase [Vibrio amylolyticus]MCK6264249.1 alpha/beta hydrolase [Vibrio amylolyticus]
MVLKALTKISPYFEQQGSGPPIVFIHGSYATTSTWRKMVEQLSNHYHCILIKLPGHCGTPEPSDFSNPSIETELTLLEQVVTALTDQPVHLVGHSVGASIALAQAIKGNLKLRKVTLFEPVSVWVLRRAEDHEMANRVDTFLSTYRRDAANKAPYVCGQVIDFWAGEGAFDSLPDFIKQGMEPLVENNIRHWDMDLSTSYTLLDLKSCTVPIQLVCGTESNPVANAICEHLSEHLPNSDKHVIDGASHFLVTSHVEKCLRVLGLNSDIEP